MGVRELIKSATYLVDSAGNKKAVQVDCKVDPFVKPHTK